MDGRQVDPQQEGVFTYPANHPLVVAAGAVPGKTDAITTLELTRVFVHRRDPGSILLAHSPKGQWPTFATVYLVGKSNQG